MARRKHRVYGYDPELDGSSIWVLGVDPGRWSGWALVTCPAGSGGPVDVVAHGQGERMSGFDVNQILDTLMANHLCASDDGRVIWLCCESQFAPRDSNTKSGYAKATDALYVAGMRGKWVGGAEMYGCNTVEVHPSTWRTAVLGCAANTKQAKVKKLALQFARAGWPHLADLKQKEHHVAEAVCLGAYLAKTLQQESLVARQGVLHGT